MTGIKFNAFMNLFDAVWHLLNLFLPAMGLGALSAAATKLLWRQETQRLAWRRLAASASAAAAAITVVGLLVYGQDGRMATYAAMVIAVALTLWWQTFRHRR